jgi:hypothetical protein
MRFPENKSAPFVVCDQHAGMPACSLHFKLVANTQKKMAFGSEPDGGWTEVFPWFKPWHCQRKIFYEFGKSRAAFLVAVDAALRKMSVLCAVEAFSMFRAFRFHRFGKDCMS